MPWVHAVIDVPDRLHLAVGRFWEKVFGWPLDDSWPGHPELRSFVPSHGTPYLHLQQIEGPPRVHLDLEADQVARTARRTVELGAELVAEHDRWVTFRSPGGLEFCVVPATQRELPEPVTWPDGHRSRMVQLCIDSPSGVHDEEVSFWRALLPGRWARSGAREFAGKWHDDAGSPVQLLFQRLDEMTGPTRAHLDHGTDDLVAEVRRLCNLGASSVAAPDHEGWHVLRDPADLAFCVTRNSPASTRLRHLD
jgi:predicted enzyme related to lactoylglutathione lyase